VTPKARENLVSLLDHLLVRPDLPAFVRKSPYRRFCWSTGEIRTAALAFAARLQESGVGTGDRVLLQGPDSPEWVAAFFGIAAAGAVAVPLDLSSAPEFVRKVARKTEARIAVVSGREGSVLEGTVSRVEGLEGLGRLRKHPGPLPSPYRAAPEETAEIVFTSGTTTEPKGVELTHANLLTSLAGIEAGFRKRELLLRPLLPMRLLCLVPLSHLFGQSLGILVPILMRSTGVFSSTLAPARLLGLVRKEAPIAIVTVPRVLAGLRDAVLREIEMRGATNAFRRAFDRSEGKSVVRRILATRQVRTSLGWRSHVLVVGGAALDGDLEAFWSRCGFAVIQGYGMTEAAPIIAVHNPLDGKERTLGRALGHLDVRLAEDGEVLVRGPNVMKGYYRDPEATREAIQDGWLRTGDLAERDAEGRLYFKGRKKDVIVLPGGLNVHPSDVESVLESVKGVREAVVFAGRGDAGDEVHAAILTEPEGVDRERIRDAANARLLPHQRIRRLVVWEGREFPRTPTGKIRRGEVATAARILESLAEEKGPPAASASAVAGRVAAALARVRQDMVAGLDPSARLQEDLGLDSLDVVELLSALEEEHDVAIPDQAAQQSLTVSGLERLLGEEEREHRARVTIPMPRWNRRGPLRLLRAFLRPVLLRPLFWRYVSLDVEGRELRDVHQALDAGEDLDEGAERDHLRHLPLDDVLLAVAVEHQLPGIRLCLLQAERDPLPVAVDIEHLHLDRLADLEHLRWVVHVAPRQLGDVDQAVHAVEIDERAEVDDVRDRAVDDVARVEPVEDRLPHLLAFVLEHRPPRQHDVVARAVELDHLAAQLLAEELVEVLDAANVDQRRR